MTTSKEFFDALMQRFTKKTNEKGLEILEQIAEQWAAQARLSAKQAGWIAKNADMHNIALSQDLQDEVDRHEAKATPQWVQPSPLNQVISTSMHNTYQRPKLTMPFKPQPAANPKGSDLDAALVSALTSSIKALDNALVQLNATLDRLDR